MYTHGQPRHLSALLLLWQISSVMITFLIHVSVTFLTADYSVHKAMQKVYHSCKKLYVYIMNILCRFHFGHSSIRIMQPCMCMYGYQVGIRYIYIGFKHIWKIDVFNPNHGVYYIQPQWLIYPIIYLWVPCGFWHYDRSSKFGRLDRCVKIQPGVLQPQVGLMHS